MIMATLLDIGRADRTGSMDNFQQLSAMESQRNQTNTQLKSTQRARRSSAIGSGLGMGVTAAMAFGGPIGIGVGAAAMILGGLF